MRPCLKNGLSDFNLSMYRCWLTQDVHYYVVAVWHAEIMRNTDRWKMSAKCQSTEMPQTRSIASGLILPAILLRQNC